MEATRTRIAFAGEWFTAAAFLAATVLVGVLVVRELRVAPRPAAAPARRGREHRRACRRRVGAGAGARRRRGHQGGRSRGRNDFAAGRAIVLKRQVQERGPLGPREIRSYELSGTRFILVLEPFERRGEPRVAAIYLE